MLDAENLKSILQDEVDKREKYRAKLKKYRGSGDKALVEFYEKRCNMFRYRVEGICDMLFYLGFLAWVDDENKVCVEKREPFDCIPF